MGVTVLHDIQVLTQRILKGRLYPSLAIYSSFVYSCEQYVVQVR